MAETKGLRFIDYIIFILKWKRFLVLFSLISLILAYSGVYYLVPVEYKAEAMIIPNEEASFGGITSLMKNFSGLSSGLGAVKKATDMDLYNTIIYSRSFAEKLIKKFDLMRLYKYQDREQAIKGVRKLINTSTTMENAFVVSATANSPKLAADMTNYVIELLNERIVELNISKSRDNRLFLEERVTEIKRNLAEAENAMKKFQENTGVVEAENQTKATIEAYSKMESDLAAKQIEFKVMERILGPNSPQVQNSKISLDEYSAKVQKIKTGGEKNSFLIPVGSIPSNALNYYRHFRDIKIFTAMLEFVTPMYEQARFDEQKDTPVLRIIDNAIPPLKKSYPPRVAMALLITMVSVAMMVVILLIRESIRNSDDPKVRYIAKNFFRFKIAEIDRK